MRGLWIVMSVVSGVVGDVPGLGLPLSLSSPVIMSWIIVLHTKRLPFTCPAINIFPSRLKP